MRTPAVATPGADATPGAEVARPPRTLPNPATAALVAIGILLVALLLPVVASAGMALALDGRVMPRVSVAGVDIGLLTAVEAEERLRVALPDAASGDLAITLDGETTRIPLAQVSRDHDFAGLVAAAMAIGRQGDPFADGQARLASLAFGSQVADAIAVDEADFDRLVIDTTAAAFIPATDAAVITNPDGTYAISMPVAGRRIHPEAVRTALAAALLDPTSTSPAVTLTSEPVPFTVSQRAAAEAAAAARAMYAAPLVLTDDADAYTVPAAHLQAAVGFGTRQDGTYGVVLDREALGEALAGLAGTIHRAPANAGFTFNGATLSGAQAAVTGRDLNVTSTVTSMVAGLEQRGLGIDTPSIQLAASSVEPEFTTAAATAMWPNMIRLSTWTTRYVPSSGNGFGANISIPAMDIDGLVILPGDDFDFWRDIGPVTFERGFAYGGAIIDGRSTGDQAIGGGICSTSTTIFNTALRAGLQMGARANHYYYIDRYPMGLDATVFATSTYEQSMTFTNDTAGPVVIRSFASPGMVRFDLWGLPTNRVVTFSAPSTWGHRTASDTVQHTASLPAGTSKRVEFPHHGFNVTVTRTVRDATTGEVIHSNTYTSYYQTVNGVVLVGTG